MKLIVTGSIAFDYLMSFPGKFTEHLLPEHMHRVSLSFLVDTMDKRRGGCAPNIASTLALLGEKPWLMATAGQDFGDYRAGVVREWRDHLSRAQRLAGAPSADRMAADAGQILADSGSRESQGGSRHLNAARSDAATA